MKVFKTTILALLIGMSCFSQKIVFVKDNASGNNDGTTWTNAYTDLQTAIDDAEQSGGGEVWVASGTYKPSKDKNGNSSPTDYRTKCFVLKRNVRVYSGFEGNEFKFNLRNHKKNIAILSGEINTSAVSDNCYNVITGNQGTNTTALIDGFTITRGYSTDNGGGANVNGCSIRNCIFIDNYAVNNGGAIRADNAIIFGCMIKYNSAGGSGGGIYAVNSTIDSCFIEYCSATNAGGIYLNNCSLTKSQVYNNEASGNGGGIISSNNTIINACRILNNEAENGGGLYKESISEIYNSLFTNNLANNKGGAIYTKESGNCTNLTIVLNKAINGGGGLAAESMTKVKNTVFWKNSSDISNTSSLSEFTNDAFSKDTALTGFREYFVNLEGKTNIFVRKIDSVGRLITANSRNEMLRADWQPASYSPIVEKGNNTFIGSYTLDLMGKSRILNTKINYYDYDMIATIDIGAFEAKANPKISSNGIIYVKNSWCGTGDGSSWENATNELQQIISSANSISPTTPLKIWVERGIWYPTFSSDIGLFVNQKVELYGGFLGNETSLEERNTDVSKTTLSADLGTMFDISDNTKTVINITSGAIVDGFAIYYGKIRGVDINNNSVIRNCEILDNGSVSGYAAAYMVNSTMENCLVYNNKSSETGNGAIYAQGSTIIKSKIFRNECFGNAGGMELHYSYVNECQIYENSATYPIGYGGGGILAFNSKIENSIIRHNVANSGGGGVSLNQKSIIRNCEIYNNASGGSGGGISSNAEDVLVENCWIYNNSTNNFGGGISYANKVLNCVIRNNFAKVDGGGIYNVEDVMYTTIIQNKSNGDVGGYYASSNYKISFSIIWGNTDIYGKTDIQVYMPTSSGIVTYSGIENGYFGEGNIFLSKKNSDFYGPNFVSTTSSSGVNTEIPDLHLLNTSPLVDRAIFNSETPDNDIYDNCRVINGAPDFGAIESGVSEYDTLTVTRLYVTEFGTGNGTSWSEAMGDINKAVFLAKYLNIPEVWVARGTYYPNLVRDRLAPITLRSGVKLYGGFSGHEFFISERNYISNPTIISGDIGVVYKNYDNSFNLIYYKRDKNDPDSALIDGFILENAYQNNEPKAFPYAVYLQGGVIKNCIMRNNIATALYAKNSYISNCLFENNTSITPNIISPIEIYASVLDSCTIRKNMGNKGGGCYAKSSKLSECKFYDNTANNSGGAINISQSQLFNNTIFHNTSLENGGGIYAYGDSTSIINTLIYNNYAKNGGGIAIRLIKNALSLTIANNKADSLGGGIYYDEGKPYYLFRNIILWGNVAPKNTELYTTTQLGVPFENSAIADSVEFDDYSNCLILSRMNREIKPTGLYPNFVFPTSFKGTTEDEDEYDELFYADWSLRHGSDCIDKGYEIDNIEFDLAGKNRTIDGDNDSIALPDIGAFETKTLAVTPGVNNTVFISKPWKGNGDGSSWENARDDIQEGINRINNDKTGAVWVSKGVYNPTYDIYGSNADTIDLREKCFVLKKYVNVYGGFNGDEELLEQRNIIRNQTILSAYPLPYEKRYCSYHVVYAPNGTDSCSLNGMYLTGGNANHFINPLHQQGGGALLYGGDLIKCFIVNNQAYNSGGGVSLNGCARMINSVVTNNTSYADAGGVYMNDSSLVDLSNIVNNEAKFKFGGLNSTNKSSVKNTVIWGNIARSEPQVNTLNTIKYSAIQSETLITVDSIITLNKNNRGSVSNQSYPNFIKPTDTIGIYNNGITYSSILPMNWNIDNGSALINKGFFPDTLYAELDSTDLFKSERIMGNSIDIGVGEYSNLPQITFEPSDIRLCEGKSGSGTIIADGENLQYSWQYRTGFQWLDIPEIDEFSGLETPTLTIDSATMNINNLIVRCLVYNQNGSVFSDMIKIIVNKLPEVKLKDIIHLCRGEELSVNTPELSQLQWSTGEMNSSITPASTGWYSITITDEYGCVNSDSIRAIVHEKPAPPFKEETIQACNGDFVWLEPGNFALYNWQDGTSTSVYIATSPGTYYLKATDDFGCSVWDTVEVLMHTNPEVEILFASYLKNGSGIFIVWNHDSDIALEEYEIYRTKAIEQYYEPLDQVAVNTNDYFVDNTIPDLSERYSYSLRVFDTCQVPSNYAIPHMPLNVKAYRRISNPNIVDILWDDYPEIDISKIYILKGSSQENMEIFAEVNANTNYFETEIGQSNYFSIAVPLLSPITINGVVYDYIYSNISPVYEINPVNDAIQDIDNVLVYPNPTEGNIHVLFGGEMKKNESFILRIIDSKGCVILESVEKNSNNDNSIDLSNCKSGVYVIQILTNRKSICKNIIKK